MPLTIDGTNREAMFMGVKGITAPMESENEVRYVLHDPEGSLESFLVGHPDVEVCDILQGYVNEDTRIRRFQPIEGGAPHFVFAFKKKVDGDPDPVELEVNIAEDDFWALWKTVTIVADKRRCKYVDGDVVWDVDFMKLKDGRTYFARAEAEMPKGMERPPVEPGFITEHNLFYAGKKKGFGNRKLADEEYAKRMMKELLRKATSADTMPGLRRDFYGIPARKAA